MFKLNNLVASTKSVTVKVGQSTKAGAKALYEGDISIQEVVQGTVNGTKKVGTATKGGVEKMGDKVEMAKVVHNHKAQIKALEAHIADMKGKKGVKELKVLLADLKASL